MLIQKLLNKLVSFFKLFKSAITGETAEFTSGSIDRAIFMLSVPMILEMGMESLFAVVDVYFVNKIGVEAVAVVGLTESVLTLIYSLAIGLSMGATAIVARRVGEKDFAGASESGLQAIYLGIALSFCICLVGVFFSRDILQLMGADEGVITHGIGYTRWMLIGNISIMLLFLNNAILRASGDPSRAMKALWIANILNMCLDPLFIFGLGPIPGFGVEGAAIATNIGRGLGVVYQFYHLFRGKARVKLLLNKLAFQWEIIQKLVLLSLGGTGQFLIASASWIFLVRIISNFGSEALAGYTIGIRIIVFSILPAWGMANAASTLVGQNLGAGKPDRAEKSVWRTGFFNLIFMLLITIIFLGFADSLVGFFSEEKMVIYYGTLCLKIVSLGYIFYGYGMVISQSFNGAGDTRTPTILNFIFFWLVQIPLAWLLAIHFSMGLTGAYSAIPIAESLLAVACILVFRRGKWKLIQV